MQVYYGDSCSWWDCGLSHRSEARGLWLQISTWDASSSRIAETGSRHPFPRSVPSLSVRIVRSHVALCWGVLGRENRWMTWCFLR